jgi:hypothetical protein
MGATVRLPAVNIRPQTSGFADSGCDVEDSPPATSCLLSTVRVIRRSSEAVSGIKRSRYSHKSLRFYVSGWLRIESTTQRQAAVK